MGQKTREKFERHIVGRDVILHKHAEALYALAKLRVGQCDAAGENHTPWCNPTLHEVVESIDRELEELREHDDHR